MAFNFTYNYPQVARESGFKLRNYKDGPLDWRLIGSMEIERILRDQSFEQIDAVLDHLSEAPLGSILDSNILDSGIAKYFMLSQFSVQYLLFCRKFLEETVTELRESHSVSQMELATLKRSLSEANNEVLQLHKKITQIEAIHEIIYPCHLCTKNFVSNDALNLHISRKHNGCLARPERKLEAHQPVAKERESDLTLINTIKLELEIKQLKERLNNAEREIKEKTIEPEAKHAPDNVAAICETSETKSVHSIGIQSNLTETKERDDNSPTDPTTSLQNGQQLCMLEEKLLEFERWKEEQIHQNSVFLNGINNKMQDIGNALEIIKNRKNVQRSDEAEKSPTKSKDLEIMLTRKMEEISKTTAANLEGIVNKMGLSYRDKLDQLEMELMKLNQQCILEKQMKYNELPIKKENCCLENTAFETKDKTVEIDTANDKTSDHTNQEKPRIKPQMLTQLPKEPSASESNHTFIKYSRESHLNRDDLSAQESTDISTSLLDEESVEKTKIHINEKPRIMKNQNHTLGQSTAKPKLVTKKEARRLTNERLSSLGVDLKTKTLTPHLKKKYLDDLAERRNKLKLEHSQFHATRNRIKKFVDKLCSTKMPPKAEILLNQAQRIRPKIQERVDDADNADDGEYSLSEEDVESLKTSTPLNETSITNHSGNFKQRLERILASPIRKPDDHLLKVTVHREDENDKPLPLPLPRKRVMFNNPEIQQSSLNKSLTETGSVESLSMQHEAKQI